MQKARRWNECEMPLGFIDLGDLLLLITLFFTSIIVVFELAERRQQNRREQRLLDAIEREYKQFFHG
jgi:hypothetical protein